MDRGSLNLRFENNCSFDYRILRILHGIGVGWGGLPAVIHKPHFKSEDTLQLLRLDR